ncbi:hypothetical protein ACFQX9_18260 [Bradyrhizobium sp. GCM10028915]|uniref:hypothetical protein n=1 Tax=Bradyrhizobium sp. GCM10028915 TaxID=3273385 RepID=UPI00361ED1ED
MFLAPRRFRSSLGELHPTVRPFAHFAPPQLRLIERLEDRVFGHKRRHSIADAYLEAHLRGEKCEALLSVLGGDPASYIRAGRLAKSAGLAHFVYAVDDPFQWESPSGIVGAADAQVRSDLTYTFQAAEGCFAITPPLAERFRARLGCDCSELPLPYCETPLAHAQTKNQIIYVGNLNYLYSAGFREVVDALGLVRRSGHEVVLRATVPRADVERVLGHVPKWVVCGRIDNRNEYLKEIADSLAAVCPISPDLPELALTSFPSKLIDYVAQARCILVHGPAECIAVKYFEENLLEFVTTNFNNLVETLRMIATTRQSRAAAYRAVLVANHGVEAFRMTVESVLVRCLSEKDAHLT